MQQRIKSFDRCGYIRGHALPLLTLLAGILLFDPVAGFAKAYVDTNAVNGIVLLAPPPETGSAEALADLGLVRTVFNARTKAEEDLANQDSSLAFSIFEPSIGADFNLSNHPRTKMLLENIRSDIGEIINAPKNYWKRKRPYQVDPQLVLGKPATGSSYPSGHSARGTVYALVLAEIFPEKQEAIRAMGRQIGWDRVILAKHYLTDVRAGRVLGQAIVRELMANPAFQKDLREAKAEWNPVLNDTLKRQ